MMLSPPVRFWVPIVGLVLVLQGCATHRQVKGHASLARLDRLMARIAPCTRKPNADRTNAVFRAAGRNPDFESGPKSYTYFSERLIQVADDDVLTALLAHSLAHQELRHPKRRFLWSAAQSVGFGIGGAFVPGLDAVQLLTDPLQKAMNHAEYKADLRTLSYLEQLRYPPEQYLNTLQFLIDHDFSENTDDALERKAHLSRRIKALRRFLENHPSWEAQTGIPEAS